MKRHPFNILSLLFGVFLIMVAASAAWITFPTPQWVFDFSDWLVPGAAILIGVALLSPLFTRRQPEETPGHEAESDASGVAGDPPAESP